VESFIELLPAVLMFLEENGSRDLLAHLVYDMFVCSTAFLTDITRHLNSLNLKLQGKQRILPIMMSDVAAFSRSRLMYETSHTYLFYSPKCLDRVHSPQAPSAPISLN